VRVNAAHPAARVCDPEENAGAPWVDRICAAFTPFLETPDRRPRPLTVRLLLRSGQALSALEGAVASLESARRAGKIGPPELHRLSLLLVFASRIEGAGQLREITDVIDAAARVGVSEVAIDGELRAAARPRVSLPSLLNVLEVGDAGALLREAGARRIHLTYRYPARRQTAARTIWPDLRMRRRRTASRQENTGWFRSLSPRRRSRHRARGQVDARLDRHYRPSTSARRS
jgi:hypothetical protein